MRDEGISSLSFYVGKNARASRQLQENTVLQTKSYPLVRCARTGVLQDRELLRLMSQGTGYRKTLSEYRVQRCCQAIYSIGSSTIRKTYLQRVVISSFASLYLYFVKGGRAADLATREGHGSGRTTSSTCERIRCHTGATARSGEK